MMHHDDEIGPPSLHLRGVPAQAPPARMLGRESSAFRFVFRSIVVLALIVASVNAQQEEFTTIEPPRPPAGEHWSYNAYAGYTVAANEGWLFMGDYAARGGGETYVYRKASGGWQFTQRLNGGPRSTAFGFSIAVDGETLVIGDYRWGNTHRGIGKVHIFQLANNRWVKVQQLRISHVPDAGPTPWFGFSVAIDGDTLVVGAPTVPVQDQNGVERPGGAVLIYTNDGASWGFSQRFLLPRLPDLAAGDIGNLGHAVAISGDHVAAAAARGDGFVLMLHRDSGTWTRSSFIENPDQWSSSDGFGADLALRNTTLIVGCPRLFTHHFAYSTGRAYVYELDTDSNWGLEATLRAQNGTVGESGGDRFGSSVAHNGDSILVGAPNTLENGHSYGAALLFHKVQGGWRSVEDVVYKASDRHESSSVTNYYLGQDVAFAGNYPIAGAPHAVTRNRPIGKAYVFTDPVSRHRDCRTAGPLASLQIVGSDSHLEIVASGLEPGIAFVLLSQGYRRTSFGQNLTCLQAPRVLLETRQVGENGLLLMPIDFRRARMSELLVGGGGVFLQVAVRRGDLRNPVLLTNVAEPWPR